MVKPGIAPPGPDTLISKSADHALLNGEEYLRNAIRMTMSEGRIMALCFEGMDNSQISEWLDMPPFLVSSHISNIAEKLALLDCLPVEKD